MWGVRKNNIDLIRTFCYKVKIMTSRSELERRALIDSGSPLARHSTNQRNLKHELQGEVRTNGTRIRKIASQTRREDAKEKRRQALYDSAVRIFSGVIDEKDLLTVLFHIEEFEQDAGAPNVTIVDFTGLKPTDSFFGEPEFFRRAK